MGASVMKLDKLMKYWPIAAAGVTALIALGTLTSVVAENSKVNDKQDEAIRGITNLQREQARTNGRIEARTQSIDRQVQQILSIIIKEQFEAAKLRNRGVQ